MTAAETETPNAIAAASAVDSLRKRADFLRVQGSRHRFSRPAFLLTCLPLPSLGTQAAVGYTVTKKLGNAVVRNRIKRRLRAIAVPLLQAHAQAGFAYVWIARNAAEAMDFTALESDMRWAMRKLHAQIAVDPAPMDGGGQLRGRGSKKHKPLKPKASAVPAEPQA